MAVKLTKWGRMRPQTGLGAPDDGISYKDESLVANVLDSVSHVELALVQNFPIVWRKWWGTLYCWNKETHFEPRISKQFSEL